MTHYITSGNDKFGNHHILWQVGNYHYEIQCFSTGKKINLPDTSFEEAKEIFDEVLKNI